MPNAFAASYTKYYGLKDSNDNYVLEINAKGEIKKGTKNDDGTSSSLSTDTEVTSTDFLYGRYTSGTTDAANGQVTVKGSEVYYVYGGYSNNGEVSGNTVTISGGTINYVRGGYSDGTSETSRNEVIISGGTVSGNVLGGLASSTSSTGAVSNNTVTISDGTVSGDVIGGRTRSNVATSSAVGNSVIISGGTIGGYVVGGSSESGTAANNIVNLTNATINGIVYGGAKTTSKYVMIEGVLTQKTTVEEGITTSNTITVSGINKVDGIDGYQNLNIQVATTNNSEANAVNLTDKTVSVNPVEGQSAADFLAGTTYYLIHSDNGVTGATSATFNTTFVDWTIPVTEDGKNLVLQMDSKNGAANKNSKTLSEAMLGAAAVVNQGAEFIADEGMASINQAVASGAGVFGVMNGGSSRYNTGSHVDVDTFSLAAGIAGKVLPNTTLAGFIEAGWGSSESYVSHARGSGEHDYYGVGVAVKHQFDNPFYLDGSVRLGIAKTGFDGRYAGDKAHYSSDMFYTSAHIGDGYVFNIADKVNMDLYGRYTITWMEDDTVKLHDKANTKLHMDSTTTHALRGGFRFTGDVVQTVKWKAGLAYEHIFNGDADAKINGIALDTPTLEGDTGIGELGLSIKPSANSPWTFDVTAKGYIGDREGYSGNIRALYAF